MARLQGKRLFQAVMVACLQFVVLTAIAMVIYPGGSIANPTTTGYSFFNNFFSELGMTVTAGGRPNPVAAVLFFVALALAGLGLVLFFVAAPRFFQQTRTLRLLSILGSLFGVISGLCYVGVAFTPANLLGKAHGFFVLNAFRSFLVVVVFYSAAIFLHAKYPKVYAWVYVSFALLLAAYLWLMTSGPRFDTAQGVMIQATGQKAIVYAAIVCMLIQGYGASRFSAETAQAA